MSQMGDYKARLVTYLKYALKKLGIPMNAPVFFGLLFWAILIGSWTFMIYFIKYIPKAETITVFPIHVPIVNTTGYIIITPHGWNSTYWFVYQVLLRASTGGLAFFGFIQAPPLKSLGWAIALTHQIYRMTEACMERFAVIDEIGLKLLLPSGIICIAILYYIRYLIRRRPNSPVLAFLMLEELRQKEKQMELRNHK